MNPQPDSILVVAPIDPPKHMQHLPGTITEAVDICRKVANYRILPHFTEVSLQSGLSGQPPDVSPPDIVFFCCHREEQQIFLGRHRGSHISNAEFLQLFKSRRDRRPQLHNPNFVIFSTCGGDEMHEGHILPQALVDLGVGVNFVVYWLGPVADDVAGVYSKCLMEVLEKTPLHPTPVDRYRESHKRAVDTLRGKIDVQRIRCYHKNAIPLPDSFCVPAPSLGQSAAPPFHGHVVPAYPAGSSSQPPPVAAFTPPAASSQAPPANTSKKNLSASLQPRPAAASSAAAPKNTCEN